MKEHQQFNAKDELSTMIRDLEINTWDELLKYIRNIPYGRNKSRSDFSLVLSEKKGTCSTKHALVKEVADSNEIKDVKLILGIYRMNEFNTPGIGTEWKRNSLNYIPEAHCYLIIQNQRVDLTSRYSNIARIEKDIIEEIEIKPEQVGEFKVNYHIAFLKKWMVQTKSVLTLDQIWSAREECIKSLSEKSKSNIPTS